MSENAAFMLYAILIGVGATAVLDLWSLAAQRIFGAPTPDYVMVGRWVGHFARGKFAHDKIGQAPPIRGEALIGWSAHYLTGIFYAGALLAIVGLGWARQPTPLPALLFGIATVIAPFFVMQPSMGAGFVASRAPNPNAARFRSIIAHTVFGVGLYLSAVLLRAAIF